MRLHWGAVLLALLLLLIISLIIVWTRSADVLGAIDLAFVAAAAALHSAGFLIFSGVWTFLVSKTANGSGPPADPACTLGRCMRVSLMSLAGLLTPMNLGTDVLRSVCGRKYLALPAISTAAASILTRECKLHVTLALIPAAVLAGGVDTASSRNRLIALFAGLLGLAVALLLFRSHATNNLTRGLRLQHLADTTRRASRRIGCGARSTLYLFFAAGFAADWAALSLSFKALGLRADSSVTFVCFAALYFLSRVPVVPLGVGLVETGGFALLRAVHIPIEQAGALVAVWGFLRIAVPYLLAAIANVSFLGERAPVVGREHDASLPGTSADS